MKLVLDENIKEIKLDNFNGGTGYLKAYMYTDEINKILRGVLEKGCSIGMHTHEDTSEIIYIISGKGKSICDGNTEYLEEGNIHYCEKGSTHTLINEYEEPLVFFAVIPTIKG